MSRRAVDPVDADRYTGACECPQCGCGSKDLKPEALPFVTKRLGKWIELVCYICGEFYIVNGEETNNVETSY